MGKTLSQYERSLSWIDLIQCDGVILVVVFFLSQTSPIAEIVPSCEWEQIFVIEISMKCSADLAILFRLSCLGYPDLAILFWLSCLGYPV